MTRCNREPFPGEEDEGSRGYGPPGTPDAGTRRADAAPDPRLLVSVPEAARLLGIGRTRAFRLVNAGYLISVKIGRSRLVLVSSIQALVNELILNPNLLNRF